MVLSKTIVLKLGIPNSEKTRFGLNNYFDIQMRAIPGAGVLLSSEYTMDILLIFVSQGLKSEFH
jgi:hypothetical protein